MQQTRPLFDPERQAQLIEPGAVASCLQESNHSG
jgi:hypothetical protein